MLKDHKIVHLSADEMIRYKSGSMTGPEMHRVESHLLDCKLCEEAMQGVSGIDNSMHLYKMMHDLHLKGRKKYSQRRKIFSLIDINTILLISFILGILIFIAWLLITRMAK